MTTYIVHIYREMRLSYTGIEADTPAAAAAIAREKPTGDADNIEDCEGENLAALVDTAGDEDYSESVTIDFEPERQRKAAANLLAALEAVLPYAESEHASLFECWRRDGESAAGSEAERCGGVINQATIAIAETKAIGVPSDVVSANPPSRFEIEHDPAENPDRVYVMVDGAYDVWLKRTVEGIVIDVYPKDWIDPIDSLTVRDDDIAQALAETGIAGEA